jgi:hypothetical protein
VSLLRSKYNVVKFANCPKGADGLYQSGFPRHAHYIDEDIALETPHGKIRGRRLSADPGVLSDADFISIDGDIARLFVPGVNPCCSASVR